VLGGPHLLGHAPGGRRGELGVEQAAVPGVRAAPPVVGNGDLVGDGVAEDRFFRIVALFCLVSGVLTLLPTLIARGIRLEREGRGSS